jgi:hypothetical protein
VRQPPLPAQAEVEAVGEQEAIEGRCQNRPALDRGRADRSRDPGLAVDVCREPADRLPHEIRGAANPGLQDRRRRHEHHARAGLLARERGDQAQVGPGLGVGDEHPSGREAVAAGVVGAGEHDQDVRPRRSHLLEAADQVHRGVAGDAEVDHVVPGAPQLLRPRARVGRERIAERDQSLSGKHA